MASGEVHDDRAAVLEVVRAYFTEASPAVEELLGGRMLDWARLRGTPAWMERFEADRTLESGDIVDLGATHAVVEVRAESRFAHVRGTKQHVSRFIGTVVLEAGVATRKEAAGDQCDDSNRACYRYGSAAGALVLVVGVECDGRDWRVDVPFSA